METADKKDINLKENTAVTDCWEQAKTAEEIQYQLCMHVY